MKKLTLICGLFIWFNAGLAAEKTIYKYTDENGVTHYSETKVDDNYKEADLPKLSVIESVPPAPVSGNQSSAEDPQDIGDDTHITLVEPQAGDNIWGSGGDLKVAVSPLSETQKLKYKLQFVLDDQKTTPGDESSHTFKLVPRGEHQVQALLITRGQYSVAGQTDKITIYIHQASKK